jgi:hypothetical protein
MPALRYVRFEILTAVTMKITVIVCVKSLQTFRQNHHIGDGGSKFLRYVSINLADTTVSDFRRQYLMVRIYLLVLWLEADWLLELEIYSSVCQVPFLLHYARRTTYS